MTQCRSCSEQFNDSILDAELREKLAPTVAGVKIALPAPKLCPDCRMQRRLIWRNELNLFRGTDFLTGKPLLTFIPPITEAKVVSVEGWHSDSWSELEFGREFDFSKPFFEQFRSLVSDVPLIALANIRCENSAYANCAAECRNCYLLGGANKSEDCLYGNYVNRSHDCIDNNFIDGCEICYECIDCRNCYNLAYSQNCYSCSDSQFLYQCRGLQHCFGCVNLANARYCLFNQQLSEEDYRKAVGDISPKTRGDRVLLQERFDALRLTLPHRAYQGERLEDVVGSSISSSRRCFNCYDASDLEDCRHCAWLHSAKSCMDIFSWGMAAELCYECLEVGDDSYRVLFSSTTWSSSDILYCYLTKGSRSSFGCVGLRNKSFCILNRQYKEAEYNSLVLKIIKHMKSTGEWGEFFPMGLSPHAYNTSVADDYFPLPREKVIALGAKWYSADSADSPSAEGTVPDLVPNEPQKYLGRTFSCSETGRPFKFVNSELQFYHQNKIPLPSVSFPARHRNRLMRRAPRKVWQRKCGNCDKQTPAVFSPNRKEIVYCPECFAKQQY